MLFDLRGRRRRAVQATYLTLALLMGGGLVLFGVGGNVGGGLFDAFKGGGGGGGNDLVKKRIERNEKRAAAGSVAALKELVRDHYQLASDEAGSGAQSFPDKAKPELSKAGAAWQRYLAKTDKPDPSLATVAVRVYDFSALNKPKDAKQAASIVAEASHDAQAYLQLEQYAVAAGDTRTAQLAAGKAVELAPRGQKKQVKQLTEQIKKLRSGGGTQQPGG
jgi:hypothetical protein